VQNALNITSAGFRQNQGPFLPREITCPQKWGIFYHRGPLGGVQF
jgi:hypothetical protein